MKDIKTASAGGTVRGHDPPRRTGKRGGRDVSSGDDGNGVDRDPRIQDLNRPVALSQVSGQQGKHPTRIRSKPLSAQLLRGQSRLYRVEVAARFVRRQQR